MRRKIRVVVVCGGPSSEREVSLKSGKQVFEAIPRNKYSVSRVEIMADGRWILNGRPLRVFPEKKRSDLKRFDVVFIALHGWFGEDGKIQAILETAGVPYTGPGVLSSALGMDKVKSYELVSKFGIRVPEFMKVLSIPHGKSRREIYRHVKKTIGYPAVVKPNESGSSVGISIVHEGSELIPALGHAFREDKMALVQKYIAGRELTCGVLGNSFQTHLTALPPVEIIPPEGRFFDYDAKYFSKETEEVCPAPLPRRTTEELKELAKRAHLVLGCDGLTRSDFILSKSGKLYFLEINTIPGLTEASLCPKEARAAGMSFSEFLDKQIELALQRFKKERRHRP